MGKSLGLVTVAYGPHVQFIDEWFHHVDRLHAQPTQITIVTDEPINRPNVQRLNVPVPNFATCVNQAIAATQTSWICKLDIDDLIFPHAFNQIPDLQETDVFMFGIRHNHLDMPSKPVTREQIASAQSNLVTSGSPFKRHLWEINPFQDIIYLDWQFWIDAAHNGARFMPSRMVDYEYRKHDQQVTHGIDTDAETRKVRGQ